MDNIKYNNNKYNKKTFLRHVGNRVLKNVRTLFVLVIKTKENQNKLFF